ncbi:MAG: hypothetical protein Q8N97_06555 [Methanobacteriaceae archaeon]|nr:hypothetical protein [Methanobacteriaceae archaeon]
MTVFGDLTSTHAHAAIPIVKVFNGKWRSTAAMGDSNSGNNQASYSFDVKSPNGPGSSFDYKWPNDVPPFLILNQILNLSQTLHQTLILNLNLHGIHSLV